MSVDFTASNGVRVEHTDYAVDIRDGDQVLAWLTPRGIKAAREFFLKERDDELGRWRYDATTVVYPVTGAAIPGPHRFVYVLHEEHGQSQMIDTRHMDSVHPDWKDAAQAWADAHPEPKPWHDAKPWETWVFTIDGQEYARTIDEDREFRDPNHAVLNGFIHVTDEQITTARRIWPEDET